MFQTTNQLKVFAPGIDRFDLWLLDHGASHAIRRSALCHFAFLCLSSQNPWVIPDSLAEGEAGDS